MSYNIDSTRIVKLDAHIRVTDVARYANYDDIPEGDFLEDLVNETPDTEGFVRLKRFDWYGEGSGRGFDFLVKVLAPLIRGEVEVVFTWEGGDSFSGLLIRDGVVAQCEVELRCIHPAGWDEAAK